jgi:hypothetical protein
VLVETSFNVRQVDEAANEESGDYKQQNGKPDLADNE